MNTYLRALAGALIAVLAMNVGNSRAANAAPKGSNRVAPSSTAFQSAMEKSMAAMDRAMMSAPMNGDPDHDFAAMMIPHHRGAVDMARVELRYGTNPILRRLAQEIIVTQQQEITVMKQQLAGPPRTSQLVQQP